MTDSAKQARQLARRQRFYDVGGQLSIFIVLLWVLLRPQILPPAPFAYIGEMDAAGVVNIAPDQLEICAGDDVTYLLSVTTRRAIGDVVVKSKVLRYPEGQNVDGSEAYGNRSVNQPFSYTNEPRAYTTPDWLEPGQYWVFVSANTGTTREAHYQVRFNIIECGAGN